MICYSSITFLKGNINLTLKNVKKKYFSKKAKKVLTKYFRFDILVLLFERKRQISSKIYIWNKLWKNILKKLKKSIDLKKSIWYIISASDKESYFFFGEFDPGSGWTLAACLRHASRTKWPLERCVLAQIWTEIFHLVADGWVTRG